MTKHEPLSPEEIEGLVVEWFGSKGPHRNTASTVRRLLNEVDRLNAARAVTPDTEALRVALDRDDETWRAAITEWLGPQRMSLYMRRDIEHMATGAVIACAILRAALQATQPSPEPGLDVEEVNQLAAKLHPDICGRTDYPGVPACVLEARRVLAARLREPQPEVDRGSEYGRLLAERDRLTAAGVDPADLETPDRPR